MKKTYTTKKSADNVKQPKVLLGTAKGATSSGWHNADDYLRCLKAGQFRDRGISVPRVQMPSHFAKGIVHHAGRARWFSLRFATDAKAWAKVLAAMEEAAEGDRLPIAQKDMQFSVALMSAYVEHWSKRTLPNPIAAEYALSVPDDTFKPFVDAGVLSRTVRFDDVSKYPEGGMGLYLGESKTTSGSPMDSFREYKLHGQIMMQYVLWHQSPEGAAKYGAAKGVMLDVTKKPSGNEKPDFARFIIPVTMHQAEWFVRSMQHHLKIQNAVKWDSEVPRNPKGCTFMAGRARVECDYQALCISGKVAASKYIMKDGSSLTAHKPQPGKEKMPWE